MEHILETNDQFPFDKITTTNPIPVSSGVFYMKFSMNGMPVYVHPPKCSMKPVAATTKTKKTTHADFIFSQENYDFLKWIESLEEFSHRKIYENRAKCFETDLELSDIESLFTSPAKMYKSGKYYLVKANFPKSESAAGPFKIYDENENEISVESITEKMGMMIILEIQGLRCSSNNFQVEFEVKQMMVLQQINLFDKCLFKTTKQPESYSTAPIPLAVFAEPRQEQQRQEQQRQEQQRQEQQQEQQQEQEQLQEQQREQELQQEQDPVLDNIDPHPTPLIVKKSEYESSELHEVDFDLDDLSKEDTVVLKQRNEVYYQMYIEARRKAKIARDLALTAYLEAKRIKNTYMLDDIIDSDDDDEDDDDDDDEEVDEEDKDKQ